MEPGILCALGLLAHLLAVLAEMSHAAGKIVTPLEYIKKRPYKLSLAIIGAIVGYAALEQMGELTQLTAFGIGYMANDSIDRMGKITASRMGST